MVRDLILDMKERDLLMNDKSSPAEPIFDSLWGNLFDEDAEVEVLICNIIIPEAYWSLVMYRNRELIFRFKSDYAPYASNFRIRLVALKDGKYSLFSNVRGDFGLPVSSYALSRNIAAPIHACMLRYVDIDGEYLVKFVQNYKSDVLDKAYIYSMKSTDIHVDFSDNQASQLLTLCAPGNSYRFPTVGVGITHYLNSVISHSDLDKILEAQFENDSKPIQDAFFDDQTGLLDVLCMPEKEKDDPYLEDLENLNIDFFSMFDDDYVRRNVVLNEVNDVDFISLLNQYPRTLELLMFRDSSTQATHISSNVVAGQFDCDGNILPSTEYFIVSATLEPNTIIMFDDQHQDEIKDAPIFIVNNSDETRLYTALIEQPYWITETCNKCFVLKQRATVKYMVRQDRFKLGKGLYIVPQTSENIKNMIGLVQDEHTGRILGIVSNNTNISDISLDEITQHIYASQTVN